MSEVLWRNQPLPTFYGGGGYYALGTLYAMDAFVPGGLPSLVANFWLLVV